jgi:hypothetical protein
VKNASVAKKIALAHAKKVHAEENVKEARRLAAAKKLK